MRTIIVVLLMCLLSGHLLVFAAEPTGGVLMPAVVREATRLASLKVVAAQAGVTQKKGSSGHPVLIGAAIGAGVGAVAGYFGSSCSVPPPDDDLACGTHYKGGSALLGAGLGAGVGALIALAFRH
jgi:hypothetical protein